jgi:competence protein ComEC
MTKILHQAVFLRLTLFFIPGIIIQTWWDLSLCWMILALLSLPLIGASFIPKLSGLYGWRWLFGFGLFLLCISSAGLLTASQWKGSEWKGGDGMREYEVQILEEPVKKPRTWMCKIGVNGQKAIIYVAADSLSAALLPADRLAIKAQFEKVEAMYLRKQGIGARAFVAKGNWQKAENSPDKKFNLRFSSLKYRRILLNQLKELIPEEKPYAIAAAILFGYVNAIDSDLRQTFAATGSSHILSVSGLHFSIIYGILYFLFSFLGNSRKGMMLRQIILLPLMWVFAFLTGLEPCVIRSAIMLSLWGIGNGILLRAFTLNTVGVAAFFMLLYNPFYLFDVGFQLSFLAVLAILLINPHLTALHESKNPAIRYVWELSCVSTSAQLGTAPLSMYYFHQFPLIYLVTNIFAIPLTGILMFLIPASLLLQALLGNYPWLTYPVNQLLTCFISGLEKLEEIPNGLINSIDLSVLDTISLTLILVLSLLLWIKKRIIYLYLILLFVVLQVFYYLCPL